jgi:L-amino acid N-acyltransferase YncA
MPIPVPRRSPPSSSSPAASGSASGRALFARAVADLRARGFEAATLWVLRDNQRARRFYEAAGWRLDGSPKSSSSGVEMRYRVSFG